LASYCIITLVVVRLKLARPTLLFTLSLHDALPISHIREADIHGHKFAHAGGAIDRNGCRCGGRAAEHGHGAEFHQPAIGEIKIRDRKSTRLNSSHVKISYAVFCLKKKI